jgi:hypothetical protein
VTKDVANDFDVGPGVDLPGRMTVPKSMCANDFGRNSSHACIVPDTVANGGAGHRLIRHIFPDEELLDRSGGRPFLS